MEDCRGTKQALHWVPVETEVDRTSPGKTPSGETLNRWTRQGMASVSALDRVEWKEWTAGYAMGYGLRIAAVKR